MVLLTQKMDPHRPLVSNISLSLGRLIEILIIYVYMYAYVFQMTSLIQIIKIVIHILQICLLPGH